MLRGGSRDPRHFERPSPRSSVDSAAARRQKDDVRTLISQWDLVSSCNGYLRVRCGLITLCAYTTRGMGFYTLCATLVYYILYTKTHDIPMGGVCGARKYIICTRVLRIESITKIRWPAINPTRKMLSCLFHYLFFFLPPRI